VQSLKHLKVCLRERETILDKILLELCIPFLISRASLVAELVEGDVFDSIFQALTEPSIDKSSATLDIIGISTCKCDEVHRVIPEIVETGESCDSLAIAIHTPLADFARVILGDTLVVRYIVALEPVLHTCRTERR